MGTHIPSIVDTKELLKKNQIGIVGVGETEQGKIPGKSSFHFYQKHLSLQLRMRAFKNLMLTVLLLLSH